MTQHSENCSSAAAYAERVFQQLEDNRPSDAPDDFSDPSPEKPTPGESKTTGKSNQPQPVRSNTVGSPDVHAQSKTSHGHVQQLIASYEARSRRTEDLAHDMAHREREVAAAGRAPPQARTSAVQQETPFFCPACIADDEKEWIRAVEADADS
ncbi:hypothetical protein LZ32DRAFT_614995 [Colletotrichum eremochloae]|nr:hypothetical protein LZ32DRAFT_614995 [Colletotrichum eremochloae]